MVNEEDSQNKEKKMKVTPHEGSGKNTSEDINSNSAASATNKKGMVLPFQPLSLSFEHVNYYVDMPAVSSFLYF